MNASEAFDRLERLYGLSRSTAMKVLEHTSLLDLMEGYRPRQYGIIVSNRFDSSLIDEIGSLFSDVGSYTWRFDVPLPGEWGGKGTDYLSFENHISIANEEAKNRGKPSYFYCHEASSILGPLASLPSGSDSRSIRHLIERSLADKSIPIIFGFHTAHLTRESIDHDFRNLLYFLSPSEVVYR